MALKLIQRDIEACTCALHMHVSFLRVLLYMLHKQSKNVMECKDCFLQPVNPSIALSKPLKPVAPRLVLQCNGMQQVWSTNENLLAAVLKILNMLVCFLDGLYTERKLGNISKPLEMTPSGVVLSFPCLLVYMFDVHSKDAMQCSNSCYLHVANNCRYLRALSLLTVIQT